VTTWHVGRRRLHPWTRLYVAAMRARRDDRAFSGERHTRRVALHEQRRADRPPTLLTRWTTRVGPLTGGGLDGWVVRPRRRRPAVRVVYLHGGGYVHPLTADYWRLVRSLVRTPAEVFVPAYPLTPGAGLDDVLPRLADLQAGIHRRHPDLPVVVMGDSAGGALALALALDARDRGRPAPASVVGLCPWLDATLSDDEVHDLEPSDPMLAESGLRAAGRWWADPHEPDHPAVSPVTADLRGLPPVRLWVGDRDILRPAVDRLAARADRDGLDLEVTEEPALFHVWMTRAVPEARRTRAQLVEHLRLVAGR
jgi:monoterpene epsilon-lactone hydrolase